MLSTFTPGNASREHNESALPRAADDRADAAQGPRRANSRLGKTVSMRSGVEFHRLLESLERVFSPLLEVQTRPGDQILDGP